MNHWTRLIIHRLEVTYEHRHPETILFAFEIFARGAHLCIAFQRKYVLRCNKREVMRNINLMSSLNLFILKD